MNVSTAPTEAGEGNVHQITPEQFLEMEEAGRYELIDGRLVERHMGEEAAWIEGRIFFRVMSFTLASPDQLPGSPYPSGLGYRLFAGNTTKFADVSFIGADRRDPQRPVRRGWTTAVPELVVEVVSPRDNSDDVEQKALEWLGVGVAEVWVVRPGPRLIDRYRPGNEVARFGDGATIACRGSLEGLAVAVTDVLPAPAEPETPDDETTDDERSDD